ncbi:MAG: 3-deoxy-8-phosphooctulonate synthase [Rhodospirillaceae bacterium]|nr:3-deoxy-8-phosphooctulonate synthase [Rhodospirillaceae bacterium]
MLSRTVTVRDIAIASDRPFVLIAGPCAMESRGHALEMAAAVKEAAENAGIRAIYKSSFDKANRTSVNSPRGIGLEKALNIFDDVRSATGLPILSDVHTEKQCAVAGEILDVLQIPAFLCRQTDLLIAAGETGKAVNVKKGQFLAPWDMQNVVAKISSTGNTNILQTERGTSFGYNTLITDFRSLPILAQNGYPVVFDATHSVQQPGGKGHASGGQREFVPVLARAAVAVGVAAIFMETHQDPDNAPSDGPNMVPVQQLPSLLKSLAALDILAKEVPVSFA